MTLPNLAGPWVDVRSFAPPEHPRDGSQPWDVYIQAAVDYLIGLSVGSTPPGPVGTLYFPPGSYRIDMPIRITTSASSGAYTFCSINITGDAPPYGGRQFHGSTIVANFRDKPAIIIQCGRSVRLENLAITGKNTFAFPTIDTLYDDATFLAAGITDASRHSPYAGVCIDPFCSPKPTDSYPGLDAFYVSSGSGRSGSSAITIESCDISNFVVGIAISPNQFLVGKDLVNTQNAENIAINACSFSMTKSAIAVCQDQSRSVTCRNLSVVCSKYVIDCTHYGKGTGPCPSIFGATIGWVKYLFSTASFGSGAVIDGLYCEAVLSIGVLGGGGARDGYVFNGCAFNLICSSTRPTVGFHLVNQARATFNACSLGVVTVAADAVPLWIYGDTAMSFHDCSIGVANYPDNALPFWINGSFASVVFDNTAIVQAPFGATLSRTVTVDYMNNILNQTMLPGCFLHALLDNAFWGTNASSPCWIAGGQRGIGLGDASTTSLSIATNGTATFMPPTRGVVAVGDFIYLRKSYGNVIESYPATASAPVIGKVTAVDATTGLATLGWVPDYVASGAKPGAGDLMYVVGFYKVHHSTTGTVTNGSNVITGVSASNASTWIASDRIRDDAGLLPANAYVKSYNAVAATITLSRTVTANTPPGGQVVNLYDADVRTFSTSRASAPPASGTWKVGDIFHNNLPAVGSPIGWVCIGYGTPGTWHPFGTIM